MIKESIDKLFKAVSDFVPNMASQYVKRAGEKKYDEFFQTEVGKALKNLEETTKYTIEGVLYFLTAMASKNIPENTPPRKFAMPVLTDVAAEFSKRMINNTETPVNISPTETAAFFQMVFEKIDDDVIKNFYADVKKLDENQRRITVDNLARVLNEKNFAKFTDQPKWIKQLTMDILAPKQKPKENIGQKIEKGLDAFNTAIETRIKERKRRLEDVRKNRKGN